MKVRNVGKKSRESQKFEHRVQFEEGKTVSNREARRSNVKKRKQIVKENANLGILTKSDKQIYKSIIAKTPFIKRKCHTLNIVFPLLGLISMILILRGPLITTASDMEIEELKTLLLTIE